MCERAHFSSSLFGSLPQFLFQLICDCPDSGLLRAYRYHEATLVEVEAEGGAEGGVDLGRWSDVVGVVDRFRGQGKLLKSLNLSGHDTLNNLLVSHIALHLSAILLRLDISGCCGYSADCSDVIRSISSLTSLTCLNVADNPDLIDDAAITVFTSRMRALRSLDVSGCVRLTDQSLYSIATGSGDALTSLSAARNVLLTHSGAHMLTAHCRNLSHLDLNHCPLVSGIGVMMAMSNGQLNFASRTLTSVNFDSCCELTGESLEWLCAANSGLKRVSLRGVRYLEEGTLLGLMTACPQLTLLNLSGCVSVTGRAVRAIASHCSALTDLNLSSIPLKLSAKSVADLLLQCSSMVQLDLSRNRSLGDEIFENIGLTLAAREQEENASTTDGGRNRGKNTRRSSSRGVKSTDSSVPRRRSIRRGVSCDLSRLTSLNISYCGFSAYGVACFAEKCASLVQLDLCGLSQLTDGAVSVVVSCCRALAHLWVDDCPALTNYAVVEASYGLPCLLSLHLSSSAEAYMTPRGDLVCHQQYSDDAVEAILDGARGIREVCNLFVPVRTDILLALSLSTLASFH